ncbi:MAG: DinB family protein [Candidatus Hydrogenedentes bacterium]|nr:DinB family protein [Candidatus Hydrogenedentota bacterium]
MSTQCSPYSTMSERAFIGYTLGYTMNWIIDAFCAIPDEWLCRSPHPGVNAPGWIFGHIAVTERRHVGMVLEGVDDIPKPLRLFHAGARPGETEIAAAIESKEQLVEYWRTVRQQTECYLERIRDDDLSGVPSCACLSPDDPNRQNPRREWLVMTIHHQNYHWGQLGVISGLLGNRKGAG